MKINYRIIRAVQEGKRNGMEIKEIMAHHGADMDEGVYDGDYLTIGQYGSFRMESELRAMNVEEFLKKNWEKF